jgi:serine/threonine protein kinase
VVRELQPGDPRLIGPYRLLGEVGSGGMGRVFLGLSAGGRPVAVKVIRADLAADPDFRARFRREVAAARKVSGVFTAPVVDAGLDAPEPWLVTAYVAGPSLSEAVRDQGPLPADSVLALAAGLAESLAAIHDAGVVHRDLKPANVLLAEDGPRVIDFGISRGAEATSMTHAGFILGSPGFMSPEQAEGGDVGPASDMFSLGAVLTFAATGETPFGNGSTAALVYRVVHSPARLDRVPEEIRPLVDRCLAKDPAARPTAGDLLALAGAVRPVTGWLPEAMVRAFPALPALISPPGSSSEPATPVTPLDTAPTIGRGARSAPPAGAPEVPPAAPPPEAVPVPHQRRRFMRPVAWAGTALLLAAVAAGVILSGGGGHPDTSAAPTAHSRPQVSRPPVAAARHSAQPAKTTAPPEVITPTPPATEPSSRKPAPKRAPSPAYHLSYGGAGLLSCSAEGSVHSVGGGARVVFAFINNSRTGVRIIWLNATGTPVLYDTVSPDAEYRVETYVGHYWLLETPDSRCLGIFDIAGEGEAAVSS